MKIKNPKFDLYEFVWLNWNGALGHRRIVRRWFDLESESWFYQFGGTGEKASAFYPESLLEVEGAHPLSTT